MTRTPLSASLRAPTTAHASSSLRPHRRPVGGRRWFVATSLALLASWPAQAQIPSFATNPWRGNGPGTARVWELAASRAQTGLVYALGGPGTHMLRSEDGGDTWAFAENFPLPGHPGLSLMADPVDPARVLAWSVDSVYLSSDRGTTWVHVRTFVRSSLRQIAVDPTDSRVIFAATLEGLFRSTDGGATWTWMRTDWGFRTFYSVAVDPDRPFTVYAAGKGGVHRSDDRGETWRIVSWPELGPTDLATAVAVISATPKAVVANGHGGFHRSTDEGLSWSKPTLPPGHDSSRIELDPREPDLVYLVGANEVLMSLDGGLTWSDPIRPPGRATVPTWTEVQGHPRMLARDGSGSVFRSDDLGATWTLGSLGLPGCSASLALVPGTVPGTLYALTEQGMFLSSDGAVTWRLVHTETPLNLTIDPGLPSRMWTPTNDGLWVSHDGGASWSHRYVTSGSAWVLDLAAAPTTPTTLLASTGGFSYTYSGWGVHLSIDGGETWRKVLPDLWGPKLLVDPVDPSTIYAGGGHPLMRSRDAGASWIEVGSGVPERGFGEMAVAPETPWVLFGYGPTGVYRSTDSGTTWSAYAPLPQGEKDLGKIAVVGGDQATLLFGGNAAVWAWDEAGTRWVVLGFGLPRARVLDLLVDHRGGWTVYAATSGRGVYAMDLGQRPVRHRLHRR